MIQRVKISFSGFYILHFRLNHGVIFEQYFVDASFSLFAIVLRKMSGCNPLKKNRGKCWQYPT